MAQSKNKLIIFLQKYGIIIIGSTILSFGIYNIHHQSLIAEGGELGIELLLKHFFGISPAITAFVFDFLLFTIGYFVLGNKFALKAILGTCTYSITYYIFEKFPPLIPNLSHVPILASIIGALFVGVGCGLVVKHGGASGGDDALALLVNKFTKLPIGLCYFLFDFIVIMVSLSYISLDNILFSFITASVSSLIIGLIQII